MANCRKKGKKKIAFWLTPAERGILVRLAKRMGVTMTDVIRTILIERAQEEGTIK